MAAQAIFALLLSFHLGKNQTHRASPDFFLAWILRRSMLLLTAVEMWHPQPQQMDRIKQNKKFAVWFLM